VWPLGSGRCRVALRQACGCFQVSRSLKKPIENPEVKPFESYCLRQTALTNLAKVIVDPFTLALIAGHSSNQITMRNCHPQADAIERALEQMTNRQELVTDGGQCKKEGVEGESESQALTLTAKKG